MKAFKGFNPDLTCRGFQFAEGATFETDHAELCATGFHACESPLDVFSYYPPGSSVYRVVELDGVAEKREGGDSKVAARKLTVGASVSLAGLARAHVEFVSERLVKDKKKSAHREDDRSAATNTGYGSAATNTGNYSAATNTGYGSAATNTGYGSAATNTGYGSAATNTGYGSAATNTGNYSAATNTGNYSAATNTGYGSAATNTGNYSAATNTGNQSAATNTGNQSAATNTGNQSAATNTGNYSAATNTGNQSAATVEGNESVAVVTGAESKASGALGCWLVLTERLDWREDYRIKEVKAFKVDGKKVKADTFYKLVDGKAVEA